MITPTIIREFSFLQEDIECTIKTNLKYKTLISQAYELFFSICTIEVLMEGIDSMILARTPNRGKCEKLLTSKQGMDCKVRVC